MFLDDVLKHPLLMSSEAVWDFLTIESEKDYDRKKRELDKLSRPKEPSDCVTPEGKARVSFTSSLEQTCNEIHVGVKDIREDFKRFVYPWFDT